jgi:hypothetical protein
MKVFEGNNKGFATCHFLGCVSGYFSKALLKVLPNIRSKPGTLPY